MSIDRGTVKVSCPAHSFPQPPLTCQTYAQEISVASSRARRTREIRNPWRIA